VSSPYAPLAAAQASRTGADRRYGWVDRLISDYDLNGPRIRLGLAWFVLAVAAALVGMVAVAVLFGLVAGAAGLQTAGAWRRAGRRPHQLVAGVGAVVMPVAALFGIGLAGVAALAFVVAATVAALRDPRRRTPLVVSAGDTIRSGFFVGLAAAAAVLLARTDAGALVVLVVLVSGYEVGDYVVGTGADNPAEGPIAGIAAVAVLTFAVAAFELPPFDGGSAWVFGLLVAALAPLGRFVAGGLAPPGSRRVPALRRLDSWLIVAPVWAVLLWRYLGL